MFEAYRILNVPIHHVSALAARERLDEFVRSRRPHHVVTVNMDFLRLAQRDPEFLAALNAADLAVPDGVPVLWIARLFGHPVSERVTGVDILVQGAALAAECGYTIFLLGAAPGIAEEAAVVLRHRYAHLRVATYAPPVGPFTVDDDARMIAAVRAAQPDLLFVAFGAPRQEVWIRRHLEALGVPVAVGVGGAFNFIAGRVPRAPSLLQRVGLEWAFRLKQEPRRLWRRYLLGDLPLFVRLIAAGLLPVSPLRRWLAGAGMAPKQPLS